MRKAESRVKELVHPFKSHPESVGESYFQHMRCACGFGFKMLAGGIACIAHGIFPFLFTHTGSDTVQSLHGDLSERRNKADTAHGFDCWSI